MELGYVRQDARGRLPGVPLPIGVFSSAAEAMIAVELYEAALAGEAIPGVPTGEASAVRVLADGGDLAIERTGADLRLMGERSDGAPYTIARLHRPGPRGEDGFGAFERPPGIEDPGGIDAAILGAIADMRTARRGRGGAALQPVTEEEFRAWKENRGPRMPSVATRGVTEGCGACHGNRAGGRVKFADANGRLVPCREPRLRERALAAPRGLEHAGEGGDDQERGRGSNGRAQGMQRAQEQARRRDQPGGEQPIDVLGATAPMPLAACSRVERPPVLGIEEIHCCAPSGSARPVTPRPAPGTPARRSGPPAWRRLGGPPPVRPRTARASVCR